MAESVKEGDDYKKLRDSFHAKLIQFHQANNNPIKRFPLLGGKELDMYHLYTKVKSLGGSKRITQDRLWGEVARSFNLPPSVTSASYACRQNFIKYLEAFERYELGEPVNYRTNDTPRQVIIQNTPTSASSTPLPNTPSSLNASPLLTKNNLSFLSAIPGFNDLLTQLKKNPNLLQQISTMPGLLQLPHNQLQIIQLLLQQLAGIQQTSRLGHRATRYDWLVRSLQCGYPNEVDIAVNALLMLSFDTERILSISQQPHLLSVLLAHLGIFWDEDTGLESLYMEWYKNNEQDYFRLWQEITPNWVNLSVLPHDLLHKDHFVFDCLPNKSVTTHDSIESFRLPQILLIIRNLSFNDSNAKYFAKHEAILRLMFLSINCSLPQVKSFALETLVNIASHLVIHQECEHITQLILTSIYDCILTNDRHSIIRGLEIISELCWCIQNEISLSMIHFDIIQRIIQLLLVPDYQVIQTCLDALYSLSLYGGRIGEMILRVDHCVTILIGLVTVKVEDLCLESLNDLLLVHPNGKKEQLLTSVSSTNQTSADNSDPQLTTVSSSSATGFDHTPNHTPTGHPSKSRAPLRLNEKFDNFRNLGGVGPSPNESENSIEKKMKFAANWLKSEYTSSQEEFIPKLDIYGKYLSYCAQLKHTNAATQLEFDQIFRGVFPHVVMTTVRILGQDTELIGGIGLKKTLPIFPTPTPSPPNSLKSKTQPPKSVSPAPPTQSLSPLQQLLQATKSQNAMKAGHSQATPSPLLHSRKVSAGLKLKRPPVNNFRTSQSTASSSSLSLNDVERSQKSHSQESSMGMSPSHDYTKMNGDVRLAVINQFGKRHSSEGNNHIMTKKHKTDHITSNSIHDTDISSTTSDIKLSTDLDLLSRSASPSGNRSVSPLSSQLAKPVSGSSLLSDGLHSTSSHLTNSVEVNFTCHWDNCLLVKNNNDELFSHIYYDHIPQITSFPLSCQWANCSNTHKRMKPSLLQHIKSHHCSTDPIPVPLNVTDTLLKLRLVSLWKNEHESCVTKSIRLTSALVIRNLLDKLPQAQSQLIPYESLLAQISMSNNEASNVASQCMYLLSYPVLSDQPL